MIYHLILLETKKQWPPIQKSIFFNSLRRTTSDGSLKLKPFLGSKEVLDVTLGTEPLPTDLSKLPAWRKKDSTAMAILSKALDDEHHNFIRACTSAKEMWTTIVALKEQATQSTKLLAQQEFHAFKWDTGDDCI